MNLTRLIFTFILVLITFPIFASKSIKDILTYKQPDGTIIKYRLYGDEFFSYKKDLEGNYIDFENGILSKSERISLNSIAEIYNANKASKIFRQSTPLFINRNSIPYLPEEYIFPVILVEFSDCKFTVDNPIQAFDQMLNSGNYILNGATGSASDYLSSSFSNLTKFRFDICPIIISLPKPKSYYGNDSAAEIDVAIREMVESACREANTNSFDFSKYDLDNTGNIRGVNIIYAGYSQSETGINNDIWPQYFNINNLTLNGVSIMSVACSSELSKLGIYSGKMSGIGTFCHEFCHILGLPDFYDTNGEEEGLSEGLNGSLSIMDSGNYLNFGKTPPYLNAIEKEILGFIPNSFEADKNYIIKHYSQGGAFYRINTHTAGEYFLIEHRNNLGWDKYIGKTGLVIYHIDKSENIFGNIKSSLRWTYNNINTIANHPCARVFYFDNNIVSFTNNSNPPLLSWSAQPLEIYINEILYSADNTKLNTIKGLTFDESLQIINNPVITPYQIDCKIEWDKMENPLYDKGEYTISLYKLSNNSDAYLSTIKTNNNFILIDKLEAGTKYKAIFNYSYENHYTNNKIIEFTTKSITSQYPYIYTKEQIKPNENIDFKLLNIGSSIIDTKWMINNTILESNSFTFKDKGRYELKALVKYDDKSEEVITKIINIF